MANGGTQSLSRFERFLGSILGYDVRDVDEPVPKSLPSPQSTMRAIPDIPKEKIKALAEQIRHMTPDEQKAAAAVFGHSISPENIRVGHDPTATDTTLRGWVDQRLPTVVFMAGGDSPDAPRTFLHELTHTWQNQSANKWSDEPEHSTYDYEFWQGLNLPFEKYGQEEQADMVRDKIGQALDYVQGHPVTTLPRADVAFLDSVKQRYFPKLGEREGPGGIGMLRPVSVSEWEGEPVQKGNAPSSGYYRHVDPFALEEPPTKTQQSVVDAWQNYMSRQGAR